MEGDDVGVLESVGLETGFVESRHARAEIAGRAESDDTVCRVGLFQRFVCSLEIRNVVGRFRPEPEMRFIHDFIVGNAFSGVLRIGGDKAFPEFNRRFEESCSGEILLTSSEFLFAFGDQPVGESFRPGPFDVAGNPEIRASDDRHEIKTVSADEIDCAVKRGKVEFAGVWFDHIPRNPAGNPPFAEKPDSLCAVELHQRVGRTAEAEERRLAETVMRRIAESECAVDGGAEVAVKIQIPRPVFAEHGKRFAVSAEFHAFRFRLEIECAEFRCFNVDGAGQDSVCRNGPEAAVERTERPQFRVGPVAVAVFKHIELQTEAQFLRGRIGCGKTDENRTPAVVRLNEIILFRNGGELRNAR